jgi:hypothetical protein
MTGRINQAEPFEHQLTKTLGLTIRKTLSATADEVIHKRFRCGLRTSMAHNIPNAATPTGGMVQEVAATYGLYNIEPRQIGGSWSALGRGINRAVYRIEE